MVGPWSHSSFSKLKLIPQPGHIYPVMLRLKAPALEADRSPKRIIVDRVVTGDIWDRHAITETTTIDGIQHDLYGIVARETKRLDQISRTEGLDGPGRRALKLLIEAFDRMRTDETRAARLQMDQDSMMTLQQAQLLLAEAQGAGTLRLSDGKNTEEDNGSDDTIR